LPIHSLNAPVADGPITKPRNVVIMIFSAVPVARNRSSFLHSKGTPVILEGPLATLGGTIIAGKP
jgi:hypothetical protein